MRAIKAILLAGMLSMASLISLPGCISRSVDINVTVASSPYHTPGRLLREVALPTYKLVAEEWSGSAVAIDEWHLLTAAHVVVGYDHLALPSIMVHRSLGDDVINEATVVHFNEATDLALLRVKAKLTDVAAVLPREEITNKVTWMADVIACGNSLGTDDAHVSFGRITSLDDDGFVRYDAHTMPGNSGGPLFVLFNNKWHVFSITQAGYVAGAPIAHMGLGVNPFTLADFLEEALKRDSQ